MGAKLEHVITRLAQQVVEGKIKIDDREGHEPVRVKDHEAVRVKPSDEHFWFGRPAIVLQLIHFILFQNSFEMGFFFWVWVRRHMYISPFIYVVHFQFQIHAVSSTLLMCSAHTDSIHASWKRWATSSQDSLWGNT